MLEIINLKKIYKSKKGNSVNALDGVTLSFPETGMVFLLGKSGSGKSTLLNVCGGLDSPTDGEIIIKGKSSKNFTQSDFDSYRNTFIGFIFQEYNILNEFSVENNIAIALELQGKPKDKESIDKLLKEVDLEGFGKRKPNTLSGGQKQRIAIARALIKNPEIIMADEPTGALDSNTGKQVLDTLKKLSKEKLVIVVSHDREFAEYYGDRIIELKDGKVISDVTKNIEEEKSINRNVSIVGNNYLCVQDGSNLSEEDFSYIKAFLRSNKNAIICNEQEDIDDIKKVAHINDTGKEVFLDTKESDIEKLEYTKEDSKFISSKLPIKHAFTIGISGLRNKPIRLLMTIMLCTFALSLFGLVSTLMLYDGDEVFKENMMASDYDFIKVAKEYEYKEKYYEGSVLYSDYKTFDTTQLTNQELSYFQETFGKNTFGSKRIDSEVSNIAKKLGNVSYYNTGVTAMAYLDENNDYRNSINGTYPSKDNEVAISSYLAESLVNTGLTDKNGKSYDINSVTDIIGKRVVIREKAYIVTGIFDVNPLPTKYDVIKNGDDYNMDLLYDFTEELSNGLHQVVFTSEEEIENLPLSNESLWSIFYTNASLSINFNEFVSTMQFTSKTNAQNMFNVKYIEEGELEEDEMLVSSSSLYLILNNSYMKFSDKQKYLWDTEIREKAEIVLYLSELEKEKYSEETLEKYEKDVIKFIDDTNVIDKLKVSLYSYADSADVKNTNKTLKVVGYFFAPYMDCAILNDKTYEYYFEEMKKYYSEIGEYYTVRETDYVKPADAIYDYVYISYDKTEESTNNLIKYVNGDKEDDNSVISLQNTLALNIAYINETAKEVSKIFLYVGIVMAVFAALLLSNFISTSISQKTREIGILRAVGARSADVFKIFFSESFIITLICIILSCIGSALACSLFNSTFDDIVGIELFVFGALSILILIAIAILTTLLATIFPVYKAAKKKPVDSIRSV